MEMAYLKLEQKLGREVDDGEVAEEMGITLEQYYRIKQMSSISFISLEELGYNFKKDHDSLISSLFQSDDEDVLTLAGFKELKAGLAEAIEELPEKEKLVISLYYMDELTMKETGKVLGITESRVSQLHSRAIIHLRAKLRKKKLIDG
jgi:RNA polymerase sigma factor for flagellar operon FliA